ncbi:MAG: hypothetical protein BKP49_10485 [Treponema sp. CETP13]|nr:MAG: hypothetical protein BKP49_10485 [Treponema sp. CETP13]
MNEWKEVQLGEVLEFGNGKKRPASTGLIPVYGGNGILDYTKESNYQDETIVIGRVGAYCGSVYYENKPIWLSDNAIAAKAKCNNFTKYLYYFLKNIKLNQYALGSSHPLITQTLLNSLEYNICINENEQKEIAEILSSLDDKIDLLNRQNKTLEQMAETLFRQWFVEEAQDGWEEGVLDDILSVKGGTTPSTKNPDFWNGDINWTTPRDLSSDSNMYLLNTLRKITKKGLSKISSGLLSRGTLLLSSRAPVGYLAFADTPIAINQGYIAIIDNKAFSKYWIYLWLKENMNYVKSHANGSTFQEISKSSFKALKIIIPPENKRKNFDNLIKPFFQKINKNIHQIYTLENMRDTLLPKLMNGEIEVEVNG